MKASFHCSSLSSPCSLPKYTHSLKYIFDVFGNGKDAKTGAPLFNKKAWTKADAVLELA